MSLTSPNKNTTAKSSMSSLNVRIVSDGEVLKKISSIVPHNLSSRYDYLDSISGITVTHDDPDTVNLVINITPKYKSNGYKHALDKKLFILEFLFLNLFSRNRYSLKNRSVGPLSALELTDMTTKSSVSYNPQFIDWVLEESTFVQNKQFLLPWDCNGTFINTFMGTNGTYKLDIENNHLKDIVKLSTNTLALKDNVLHIPCKLGTLTYDLREPLFEHSPDMHELINRELNELFTTQYRY